jgi:hypothetical protein
MIRVSAIGIGGKEGKVRRKHSARPDSEAVTARVFKFPGRAACHPPGRVRRRGHRD